MNRLKQILFYSITLIIILVGVIFYEIKAYEPPTNWYCNMPIPSFCGTPNLTENGEEGKEIFNSNCAACHKKKCNIYRASPKGNRFFSTCEMVN